MGQKKIKYGKIVFLGMKTGTPRVPGKDVRSVVNETIGKVAKRVSFKIIIAEEHNGKAKMIRCRW